MNVVNLETDELEQVIRDRAKQIEQNLMREIIAHGLNEYQRGTYAGKLKMLREILWQSCGKKG